MYIGGEDDIQSINVMNDRPWPWSLEKNKIYDAREVKNLPNHYDIIGSNYYYPKDNFKRVFIMEMLFQILEEEN